MKLTLALNGSRGDVQPGIAVAKEMSARGHDVVVGVPENLLDFTRGHGVDVTAFAPDTDELLRSPLVKRDLKSRNPRTRARAIREVTEFGAGTMDDRLLEISDGADLVVTGLMGQERGATVAEYRGAAFVPLQYCPVRPSRSVPVPLAGLSRLSAVPVLSEAVWRAVDVGFWLGSARRGDVALRSRLGMTPASGSLGSRLRRAGTPEIQAYDPSLFPALEAEWGEQRPMTGFVTVPEDAPAADDAVTAWLAAGPAPVYVGFGSMPLPDAPTAFTALAETIRAQGHRVLVCAGPNHDALAGRFDDIEDVLVVRAADHTTVLPRCAAAIHHGGAGTTGACLRAGLPSLIAAFSADQPLWGRAVTDAGLGATCGIRSIGDSGVVASAVRRLADPAMVDRSRAFAASMVSPTAAVESISEILARAV